MCFFCTVLYPSNSISFLYSNFLSSRFIPVYDAVIIPAAPTATFQLTSQKPNRCKVARATTGVVKERGEQRMVQRNSSPGHFLGPTSSSKQSKVHLVQHTSACIAGSVHPHASCHGWCKRDRLPLQPTWIFPLCILETDKCLLGVCLTPLTSGFCTLLSTLGRSKPSRGGT